MVASNNLVTKYRHGYRNEMKLIFFLNLLLLSNFTFADLAVTPTRIEMGDSLKAASATVINQSTESVRFKVSWVHYTMKEDGSYVETETPRQDSAVVEKSIRYSPRQVVLGPGESQVVRLALQDFAVLKDGEYRSHLVFRAEPSKASGATSGSEGVSINLAVAKGVAIPIVLRKGQLKNETKIDFAKIVKSGEGNPVLQIRLSNTGTQSAFGDLEVHNSKGETPITLKGVAVFMEIPHRTLNISIPSGTSDAEVKTWKVDYISHGKVLTSSSVSL